QTYAKTDDGFFLGFPSYWNLVAFYLYVLHLPAWLTVPLLAGLAFLTFVPTRYLYPTQRGRLNRITNVLGAAWAGLLIWILWLYSGNELGSEDARDWALVSLFFPAYYMAVSWAISLRLWRIRYQQSVVRPVAD